MSEWEQGCLRVFVCEDIQRTAKCNPCNLQWELTMTLACMGFREQSVPPYQHCTALKFLLEVIYVERVSWWEGSFEVLTVLSDQGDSTQILIKHPASRMNSLKIRKNPAFAVQRIKRGSKTWITTEDANEKYIHVTLFQNTKTYLHEYEARDDGITALHVVRGHFTNTVTLMMG